MTANRAASSLWVMGLLAPSSKVSLAPQLCHCASSMAMAATIAANAGDKSAGCSLAWLQVAMHCRAFPPTMSMLRCNRQIGSNKPVTIMQHAYPVAGVLGSPWMANKGATCRAGVFALPTCATRCSSSPMMQPRLHMSMALV